MTKLDRSEAFNILKRCKIERGADFHELDSETAERLLIEADSRGYRKPPYANGSRSRYFYEHVQRAVVRGE